MEKIVSKILRSFPPETSHKLTIQALKVSKFIYQNQTEYNNLKIKINGLGFDNPIGIAAGFDKNGEVIDPLFNVGFYKHSKTRVDDKSKPLVHFHMGEERPASKESQYESNGSVLWSLTHKLFKNRKPITDV